MGQLAREAEILGSPSLSFLPGVSVTHAQLGSENSRCNVGDISKS